MNYELTFSADTISMANTGGMILLFAIFILGFIAVVRYSAKIMPGFVSCLTYLLLAVGALELVMALLASIPVVNQVVYGDVLLYCVIRSLLAAVAIAASITCSFLFFKNRAGGITLGNSMMVGIGCGLAIAIVLGMDLLSVATVGATVNQEGLTTLFQGMEAEEIESLYESLEHTASLPAYFFLLKGIMGIFEIILVTATSILEYAVNHKGAKRTYLYIALADLFVVALSNAVVDYAVTNEFISMTIVAGGSVLAVCGLVFYVDKMYCGKELASFDKLKRTPSPKGSIKKAASKKAK
ncbi:MAG: hypothetical protein K6C69_04245 [Lachnospiraceae bacterium]|nr:hypothetical protein [Lachnospiraceae bacterium]